MPSARKSGRRVFDMGFYRGVSQSEVKKARLDKVAEQMRQHYLSTGKGCKTRAKLIAQRKEKRA